jgi:hypothetical protein
MYEQDEQVAMDSVAEEHTPLHIDEELERTSEGRVLAWVRRWVPIVKAPYGWHSVRSQLRCRRHFPVTQWRGLGVLDEAELISKIIAEELGWPSANFIPEDPLHLALIGYNEFADIALAEICRKCALSLSADDYHAIQSGGWTVGMLVLSARKQHTMK